MRAGVIPSDGFLFGTDGAKVTLRKLLKEFKLHTIVRLLSGGLHHIRLLKPISYSLKTKALEKIDFTKFHCLMV